MAEFDSKKMIDFLSDKWKGRGCPMCGQGPWNAQNRTFQLTEFHQGNIVLGGPLVPVVPVTCENCGYTALVNAIIAGVVPREQPTTEKPHEKKS